MSLTRRQFGQMAGASIAASAFWARAMAASPNAMPPDAVDCHNHIMGPQDKYPYAADRTYTPPQATVADLKALRARIGTTRNILVTPSVYGTDNRCLVDSLAELGGSARGIAVLPLNVSDGELRRLDDAGVKGIRLSLGGGTGRYDAGSAAAAMASFGPRFFKLGWNIEIVGNLDTVVGLAPAIARSQVPVVLDHFAGANGGGVDQSGFDKLLDLIRERNTFVKLSAPYNRSGKPDYSDMTPLAHALIEAGPDRMLWGTNWPHPDQIAGRPISEVTPYHVIDNENLVRLFAQWCPDAAMRRTILVDTPARLYRFA